MLRFPLMLALFIAPLLSYGSSSDEGAKRPFTIYTSFPVSEMEAYSESFSNYAGLEAGDLRWIQVSESVLMVLLKETQKDLRGDVVFGYSSGFLSAAKGRGFLTPYRPYSLGEAYSQLGDKEGYWSHIYFDLIGFGTDSAVVSLDPAMRPPRSWWDLIKPRWKGRVVMPSPERSESGFRIIATLVGLMGEDRAFEYLRRLDVNIGSYAYSESYMVSDLKSSGGGVVVASSGALSKNKGLIVTYPREGTGLELVGLGILKGTPHLGLAREFLDWALDAGTGALYKSFGPSRFVASDASPLPPEIPLSSSLQYDRWKAETDRPRLLEVWRREVLRKRGIP
jgi:iron(III) transport system substrate-binding protein